MKRYLLLLVVLLLACGPADSPDGPLGVAASALDGATSLPQPVANQYSTTPTWQGSVADLYVADAWAACSFMKSDPNSPSELPDLTLADLGAGINATNPRPATWHDGFHDDYLDRVLLQMEGTTCTSITTSSNHILQWYRQRTSPLCNYSADLHGGAAVPLDKDVRAMLGILATTPYSQGNHLLDTHAGVTASQLDAMVRQPGINLCIANKLRQVAPGGVSGGSLLMSSDDQLALLQRAVERAQEAVLGLARLVQLQRTAPDPLQQYGLFYSALEMANWWLNNSDGAAALKTELAAAVQTLAAATKDLAQLYGRNASANAAWTSGPDPDNRGNVNTITGPPAAASRADRRWGFGGWVDRTFELLYGHRAGMPSVAFGTWPIQQYETVDASSPQVQQILQLARSLDALHIKQLPADPGLPPMPDVDGSALRLFRELEAGLETRDCTSVSPSGECVPIAPETIDDPHGDGPAYRASELFKKYGPTYNDLRVTCTLLSQQLLSSVPNTPFWYTGASDLLGSVTTVTLADDAAYYRIAPDSNFVRRGLARVQSLYSGPTRVPYDTIQLYVANGSNQPPDWGYAGFYGGYDLLSSERQLGAVTVLAMAREYLFNSYGSYYGSQAIDTMESDYGPALDAISGAIGDAAVMTTGGHVVVYAPSSTDYSNSQIVYVPKLATQDILNLDFDTGAILSGEDAGLPVTSLAGKTISDVDTNASRASADAPALPSHHLKHAITRWSFPPNATGVNFGMYDTVAEKYSFLVGPSLRDWTSFDVGYPFMSTGGALNTYAARLIAADPSNPSEPRFDGFGYPTHWVPSTDPTVLNAAPGTNSVQQYLSDAQQAADSATMAVTSALQTLITDANAAADANKQSQKSRQAMDAAVARLCGSGPCNDSDLHLVSIVPMAIDNVHDLQTLTDYCSGAQTPPWNGPPGTTPYPDTVQRQITFACVTAKIFGAQNHAIRVPALVSAAALASGFTPVVGDSASSFAAYTGGQLQGVFQQQLFALQNTNDLLRRIWLQYVALDEKIQLADVDLQAPFPDKNGQCDFAHIAESIIGGFGVGFPMGFSYGGGSVSSQANQCITQLEKRPYIGMEQDAAVMQAVADISNNFAVLADKDQALSLAVASAESMVEEAHLAVASAALDVSLASQLDVDLSLSRAVQNYDVWRANALLDGARRSAVAARRAIEAYYVVDLSAMDADEPFVAAPSSWADDVYRYDLSAPSSVGLVSTQGLPSGIYPNVVSDYVTNLRQFVKGYSVARPSVAAKGDSEIVSLPGPSGTVVNGDVPSGVVDASAYRWSFLCGDGVWYQRVSTTDAVAVMCPPVPPGTDPTGPLEARLEFTLDPWGRVDGSLANPPYTARYNARWGRLAVNLVGTGVLDCTKAPDPLSCYSQPFVRYDLSSAGPAWVTDFTESWRTMQTPFLRVEGAKALAAEQWLDPVSNGWDKPFVTATSRLELTERPFGGEYALDFKVPAELNLDRIARVQLLLEASYWVRQQ